MLAKHAFKVFQTSQGAHRVLKLEVQWGTIAVFSLTLYPCIEKVPTILGVHGLFWGKKKPLQRVKCDLHTK
jgi:hypothetical protein